MTSVWQAMYKLYARAGVLWENNDGDGGNDDDAGSC